MTDKLQPLREQIDSLDRQLLELGHGGGLLARHQTHVELLAVDADLAHRRLRERLAERLAERGRGQPGGLAEQPPGLHAGVLGHPRKPDVVELVHGRAIEPQPLLDLAAHQGQLGPREPGSHDTAEAGPIVPDPLDLAEQRLGPVQIAAGHRIDREEGPHLDRVVGHLEEVEHR